MPLASLGPFSGRASRCAQLIPNGCITGGKRLFRVVSRFAGGEQQGFASLEDCLTLGVQAYSAGELAAMKLRRLVTAIEAS